jgi:hypothetical protein
MVLTIQTDNDAIATICNLFRGFNDSSSEMSAREESANARLIAAAPELLTALTGILATAEFVDAGNKRYGEDRYGFAQSLFEQCRAVIAKATIEPLKP